jgi:hypothetical protein
MHLCLNCDWKGHEVEDVIPLCPECGSSLDVNNDVNLEYGVWIFAKDAGYPVATVYFTPKRLKEEIDRIIDPKIKDKVFYLNLGLVTSTKETPLPYLQFAITDVESDDCNIQLEFNAPDGHENYTLTGKLLDYSGVKNQTATIMIEVDEVFDESHFLVGD